MNQSIPLGAQEVGRLLRPAFQGFAALLLALTLACSSAAPPQEPAAPVGEPKQTQPSQPVSQSQSPAEVAQTGQSDTTMTKSETPATAETMSQQPSEPMAAKQNTAAEPQAAEVMTAKAPEPQPEPMAKAMDNEPAAVAETTVAPAAQLEPLQSKERGVTEPAAVKQAPQPTAAPDPTAVEVPAATEAPAPVVQEPLPPVGNKVGNLIPDVTLELFGGSTVSTSSLAEQGKPTFLFFFATT